MFESGFPAELITRLVLINRLERMRNTLSIIYLEVGRSRLTGHNSFLPEDSVHLPCNNNQFEKLCFCER